MSEITPSVYVIAAPEVSSGRVKIGWTSRPPAERLATLQTGSPTPLRLVFWTEGNESTERVLHALFAARRVHGEWFDFAEEDPVALVTEAVQLLRRAVEPYDPGRMMTLPAAEEPAQLRYEERRDALISTLIVHGVMGQRTLATKSGLSEGTVRRVLSQMESDGVVSRADPGFGGPARTVTLNPEHTAVAALLS